MKVRLISDDLLFGSKVEGMIRVAGGSPVGGDDAAPAALTVLDLTDTADVAAAVARARAHGAPVLAFYAHTDADVRSAALAAGVDRLVPRSRMMREGPELILATATSLE